MTLLSQRLASVAPSQTTAFTALVAAERQKGRRIIDLAVGEYPVPAPPSVIEETQAALAQGLTRYGPVAGRYEERRLSRMVVALPPGVYEEETSLCLSD